ncbi:MAG TPA: hypothetical protein VEI26_04865 [Terriglobales bacterium]|nr:hypothetical protein [Terriglobales bacterium]
MSEAKSTKPFAQSFVVPLSREEWERTAEPHETYEGYLQKLGELFGMVCLPKGE